MRSTTSICISVRVAALQICDGFVQARIKALPNTADALDATAPQDFLDATTGESYATCPRIVGEVYKILVESKKAAGDPPLPGSVSRWSGARAPNGGRRSSPTRRARNVPRWRRATRRCPSSGLNRPRQQRANSRKCRGSFRRSRWFEQLRFNVRGRSTLAEGCGPATSIAASRPPARC